MAAKRPFQDCRLGVAASERSLASNRRHRVGRPRAASELLAASIRFCSVGCLRACPLQPAAPSEPPSQVSRAITSVTCLAPHHAARDRERGTGPRSGAPSLVAHGKTGHLLLAPAPCFRDARHTCLRLITDVERRSSRSDLSRARHRRPPAQRRASRSPPGRGGELFGRRAGHCDAPLGGCRTPLHHRPHASPPLRRRHGGRKFFRKTAKNS